MKENIGWFVGALEGDGLIKENFIEFTNNNLQLIKRFINQLHLIGIQSSLSVANINTTTQLLAEAEKIKLILKNLGVRKVFISVIQQNLNHPVIQIFVFNQQISARVRRLIKNFLQFKTREGICQFVQGFCDAEGSVHKRDKAIEVKQKNTPKGNFLIKIIQSELNKLGIKCSIEGPNCENMIILRVWGGRRNKQNLILFNELIGFSHPEKIQTFNKIINELSMA